MKNLITSPKSVKAPNYLVLLLLPIVVGISSYIFCKTTSFFPEFASSVGFFTAVITYIISANIYSPQNNEEEQDQQFLSTKHRLYDPNDIANPCGIYQNHHRYDK